MMVKTNQLPQRMGGNMVATVGEIQNYPNSRYIVPDRVHFTVGYPLLRRRARSQGVGPAARGFRRDRLPLRLPDQDGGSATPASTKNWFSASWTPPSRLFQHVLGQRSRPRRKLCEPTPSHSHDLRAQHRRPPPHRGREHPLGGLRGRSERATTLPPARGKYA